LVYTSIAWLAGLLCAWIHILGRSSLGGFARTVVVPLLLGVVALSVQSVIRAFITDMNWLWLAFLGTAFALSTALLLVAVDLLLGGDSPSRHALEGLAESKKFSVISRFFARSKAA
jgi:hypothetical protein